MKYRNYFVLTVLTLLNLWLTSPTKAEAIALATSSTPESNLLQQGKQLYDRGQFAAAAEIWQQAQQKYSQTQEIANLIHSNNYLAAVYQELGHWEQAQNAIADNLDLIARSQKPISRRQVNNYPLLQAQTFNTQGSLQLKQGNGEAALETWQQAEAIYRGLEDSTGIILSQINQAQALQTLGFYRRSRATLTQIQQQLDTLPDYDPLKIAALISLGATLEISGDLDQSQEILEQSLAIAQQLDSTALLGENFFRLGNLARTRENNQQALDYYQQAIAATANPQLQLETRLNQLSLLIETNQLAAAENLTAPIEEQLANFPPSRAAIYAKVNYAQSLGKMGDSRVGALLEETIEQAQELSDPIAQAHAIAELGHWRELNQDYQQALHLTNQALSLAEAFDKSKIVATLHWQQGRILQAQGERERAIAAYRHAIADLDNIHQDLVAVSSNLRFSFRQEVEPIYRQLVELLLQDIDQLPPQQKQQHLEESRIAIEALQQKELENFFRLACLDISEQNIEQIDPEAAVIYPILLDNSIEVILSVPGKPLQHYRTKIDSAQQQQVFKELLQYLNPVFSSTDILPTAQKLYDWLIRPGQQALTDQEIATLVFVLDGKLRSLPMNVLHDGEQYLLEKYELALTPGLSLFPSGNADEINILTAGLTEARQGFSALSGVAEEINRIQEITSAQVLLNQEFTNPRVQEQVEKRPFSVVHLATHGQFSSKAEDTFILTWADRIKVKDFDQLLSQRYNDEPIELLVLSACQTARGDEEAILGLAGMAVSSGARSTLATLWSVSDRSTAELMSEFYRHLNQPDTNKAQALRQAQLSLMQEPKYQHPYYWAPFVLVGNWH
ncbi:MAG: CHAT domain-containing protein [Cyanobacteria bacterium P01_F01_bin.143]